jgi:SpoVK/Ycf46/Vps4 family AAA+-type ATPase
MLSVMLQRQSNIQVLASASTDHDHDHDHDHDVAIVDDTAQQCLLSPEAMLHKLAKTCEGYCARDLLQLIDQIIHQASMRIISTTPQPDTDKLQVIWRDFAAARKAHTPAAFKDVQATANTPKNSWSDIGGLHQVRQMLKETFEWPSKYPELFASCPLKLRRGYA